jgi:hypothetical protein
MGWRGDEESGGSYRLLEVMMMRTGLDAVEVKERRTLVVEASDETVSFVEKNMNEIVGNLVRMRKLEEEDLRQIEESARLFQDNLAPLFTMLAGGSDNQPLLHLSRSLKKGLLLSALRRFDNNLAAVAAMFGLTEEELAAELEQAELTA